MESRISSVMLVLLVLIVASCSSRVADGPRKSFAPSAQEPPVQDAGVRESPSSDDESAGEEAAPVRKEVRQEDSEQLKARVAAPGAGGAGPDLGVESSDDPNSDETGDVEAHSLPVTAD